MQRMLAHFYRQDLLDVCYPWFERAPSYSNIADLPSRNQWVEACRIIGNGEYVGHLTLDSSVLSILTRRGGGAGGIVLDSLGPAP